MDSEIRFSLRLGYMQAWSALHARTDVKLEDSFARLKQIYFDSMGTIPYLTGGKSPAEFANDENQALLAEYREWQKQQEQHKAVEA